MRTIIEGPAAWRGAELAASRDWIHEFSGEEIAEIEEALRSARARGKTLETLTRDDFPLPKTAKRIAFARDFLEEGKGIYQFRGIKIDAYSKDDLRLLYWGLGRHIGTAVSQSKDGDILGDVRNVGVDIHSPQGRGYKSNQRLNFHTDSADVVGLFVLCVAKTGGLSKVASSVSAHNEILRRRPDLLDAITNDEGFHITYAFKPGDVQLLNNHVCFHARTAFEDYPERERRRHLLRMWLSVPNSRPLSRAMGTIYQDQRPGVVRGGFPSRSGRHIYESTGEMVD